MGGIPQDQAHSVCFIVESKEAGVFDIKAHFKTKVFEKSQTVKLEDLLKMQDEKKKTFTLLEAFEFNVSHLIILISKKFYR